MKCRQEAPLPLCLRCTDKCHDKNTRQDGGKHLSPCSCGQQPVRKSDKEKPRQHVCQKHHGHSFHKSSGRGNKPIIQPMPRPTRLNRNGALAKITTMSAPLAANSRSPCHRAAISSRSSFMTAFLLSPHRRSLPAVVEPRPIREETFAPIPNRRRAVAGGQAF